MSFKGQWPWMVYMDARAKRLAHVAATGRMRPRHAAEHEGAMRDFSSCVRPALLLDYSHVNAPFSLDFWSYAVCFKKK